MSTLREAIAQVLHNIRPKCYEDFGGEDCLCFDQTDVVLAVVHEHADIEATFDILMDFRRWIRGTDEITDHDLMVIGKQIVAAALGVDA